VSNERPRVRPRPVTKYEQVLRTKEWLAACEDIVTIRKDLEETFPEISEANRNYFIGTLVIENNLGTDWTQRHVTGAGPRTPAGVYLRSGPKDSLEMHEHYVRTMELARRLFELGQESFYDRLVDNLSQRDLEGAAFEADVVRMLCAGPFVIDLRAERGTKGDDYDIDLWLHDRVWPIEVKTRAEDVPYSDRALAKTLERARTQLPRGGVGTIFFKVPTHWLAGSLYRRGHADVVQDRIRATTRVQSVILVWDKWTPKTFGAGFSWSRGVEVFRAASADPDIAYLLKFYEKVWRMRMDLGPTAPF
jgi:hypothetical protein